MYNYEENLKKMKKPRKWRQREEMSMIQISKYDEKTLAEDNVIEVKKSIQEWILENKLFKLQVIDKIPIRVSEMDKEVVKKEVMKWCGKKDKYHYIWVSFRDNGMIVTIGRTSFLKVSGYGDLFDKFDVYGTGAQRLILKYFIDREGKADEMEQLNDKMNTFTTYALIIPVKSNNYATANTLERQLGEYLINNYCVFNYYSHNW